MKIAARSKLVMIGDSITDCGRKQPTGEGLFEAIGKGYVAMVDAMVASVYPERQIRVVNMGTSGNTARDLAGRWQKDVLDLKPDWLSMMIGINDVWRQYDQPFMTQSHVYADEYERTLEQLIQTTRPGLKGMVLMTPYYMEPNRKDPMRATMDRYGKIIKKLAAKHEAIFVDTQAAFDAVLKHYYPATLGWDRVHPNMIGHMTLARAFLNAVEFNWNGRR